MDEALKVLTENGISSAQAAWQLLLQGAAIEAGLAKIYSIIFLALVPITIAIAIWGSKKIDDYVLMFPGIMTSAIWVLLSVINFHTWYIASHAPEYWALQQVLDKLGS